MRYYFFIQLREKTIMIVLSIDTYTITIFWRLFASIKAVPYTVKGFSENRRLNR